MELKQQKDPLNQELKNSIANLQHQLNMLLSFELAHKLKLAKQSFFEHANKFGKWLAYKLCKIQADRKITKLKTQNGSLATHTIQIKATVQKHYQQLFFHVQKSPTAIYNYLQAYQTSKTLNKCPFNNDGTH